MTPPASVGELSARARDLAGSTLAAIAGDLGVAVPADLRHAKGWIGEILEAALGATGGSTAQHDFPELEVELKTIPVRDDGRPTESTFVCTAPLDGSLLGRWDDSWVRRKLSRVLWIPIHGRGAPGGRSVGRPVLWSPTPDQEAALRQDWEELADLLGLGRFDQVDARRGRVLQIRPKARTGDDLTWGIDAEGEWVRINPRGFYLRSRFTSEILRGHRSEGTVQT